MADYGQSDVSTTSLEADQFPISEVYVPNTGLKALGGGPKQTDGSNKDYAPALMYVQDGSDVAQGTTTQTKATDGSATSWSVIQLLKGIFDKLLNTLAVTQSGTWTMQPGNTANTTAWKVDGSGVTQPVSGSVSVSNLPGTQPVSGTVTANAGSGTFTNQQSNIQSDYDTTAGTQNVTMMGVALPASGGAVAGGTSSNPLRTDPTGTTTQPISGTVTANAGANLNTSLLALESGGNLASIKTDADSISTNTSNTATNTSNVNTATGTKTDTKATDGSTTAWSVIALLKGIVDKLLSTLSVTQSGTWTVQPGNTANTTAWKVDGSAVTQPVSGTVSITANSAVNVAQVAGTTTDTNSGNKSAGTQRVVLATDQPQLTNALKVDGSGVTQPVSGTFWQATQPVSGTVTANQGGTWTVQPGNTANTTPWLMSPQAATSGGATPSHTMSAATTNATSLKGSAGVIWGLDISNTNAAARYLKLYDKASSPTVGTDTPIKTIQIPANGTYARAFPVGITFSNGIAWAATGAMTNTDTTAIGANDLSVDIDYK